MNSIASSVSRRPDVLVAGLATAVYLQRQTTNPAEKRVLCEAPGASADPSEQWKAPTKPPSWIRKEVLARIGVPLPIPRVLTPADSALKLPKWCIARRNKDEEKVIALLNTAPTLKGDPEKIQKLGEQIFEVTYGKGVTPQIREDFLIKYGCTGWTDEVLSTIIDKCQTRGIVELGAGHGQWARALTEAYAERIQTTGKETKRIDFVLAYDDMSSLPLNTHIYNQYTQPHHDHFGDVKKLESRTDTTKVLRSWACRGRALLLVYPSPGDMALSIVQEYVNVGPENDTIIYIGEGRGGANGSEVFFDYLESGAWVLSKVLNVKSPPGNKGYEKVYILQRRKSDRI
ncbi:unnamed protein product [Cylindrotheca closterium]|uniref:Uncharacterized protein n=1 Tax=Cylindrotheca closterium TaxID=2856 RepID=A0AAD2PXM4_9STRA|nr:unnamed protein product [Cylindrotheca closterium]